MIKTILKIILTLIILAAVGLGVYWYFDRGQSGGSLPLDFQNLSFSDLFPFGKSDSAPDSPTGQNPGDAPANPDFQVPIPPPRFWQISTEPQSGAIAFNSSGTPLVRYTDKATGNIFESSLRLLGSRRISNTTIPKVYEAKWQPNGKAVVLRYLGGDNETIRSVYAKLATSTSSATNPNSTEEGDSQQQQQQQQQQQLTYELETSFLPENILSFSINSTTGAFAYIVPALIDSSNGSRVYITNPSGGEARQIFESPVRDFSIRWVNSTTLGLSSKPSAAAFGQFYFLKNNSSNPERLERIMGGTTGLSALSNPTGTKIAFSESRGGSISSGIFDPKTGEKSPAPITIIPEKCVWSNKTAFLYCAVPKTFPSGIYPDDWYQGQISFDDSFWRIDTATGASEFLIDPVANAATFSTMEDGETAGIDAVNLSLDPNEEYLVFTNKKDSQLWGLKILKES